MTDTDTKYCPSCEETKPLTEFYRTKARGYAHGYRYRAYCKDCTKRKNAADLRNAPEGSKLREASRRAKRTWGKRNQPARSAYMRTWRQANKANVYAAHRRWVAKHRKQRAGYLKRWAKQRKLKQAHTKDGDGDD